MDNCNIINNPEIIKKNSTFHLCLNSEVDSTNISIDSCLNIKNKYVNKYFNINEFVKNLYDLNMYPTELKYIYSRDNGLYFSK